MSDFSIIYGWWCFFSVFTWIRDCITCEVWHTGWSPNSHHWQCRKIIIPTRPAAFHVHTEYKSSIILSIQFKTACSCFQFTGQTFHYAINNKHMWKWRFHNRNVWQTSKFCWYLCCFEIFSSIFNRRREIFVVNFDHSQNEMETSMRYNNGNWRLKSNRSLFWMHHQTMIYIYCECLAMFFCSFVPF